MPHGYCLKWTPWIFWSYLISDLVTFLSYVSDFFALVYFYRHRADLHGHWIIPAFAFFIFSCGIVHGLLVVSLFTGIYPAIAFAKVMMALISAPVAFAAWPVVFHLIKIPALEAYQALQDKVNDLESDRTELLSRLEEKQ